MQQPLTDLQPSQPSGQEAKDTEPAQKLGQVSGNAGGISKADHDRNHLQVGRDSSAAAITS